MTPSPYLFQKMHDLNCISALTTVADFYFVLFFSTFVVAVRFTQHTERSRQLKKLKLIISRHRQIRAGWKECKQILNHGIKSDF